MRTKGAKPIGRFAVRVQLANYGDLEAARRGHLSQEKVRRSRIKGVVDPGATSLVLPLRVVKKLDLPVTRLMALNSNDRVRLGVIGVGNRGDQLLDALLVHKDCEIAALCDVYEPYLEAAQKKVGGKATLYHDFRKLIEQKDLDAVVI